MNVRDSLYFISELPMDSEAPQHIFLKNVNSTECRKIVHFSSAYCGAAAAATVV